MQLSIPSLIATLALATTATADYMTIYRYCFFTACNAPGTFYTSFGEFSINGSNGCRTSGVPYMNEFCIDEQKERMHFRFNGQGKRCMKVSSSDWEACGDFNSCAWERWDEVACTW